MFKRGYKLIICVVLVAALFIGFGSAFASAEPAWVTRAKAAVAAAGLALDLVLQPINVLLDSPMTSAVDPLGTVPWVETLPEYIDRSTIKVLPDVAIVDGVPYSEIWLGPEAADKLRLQMLDFASAYNILANESEAITYATGVGYIYSLPAYNVNGTVRTQTFNFSSPQEWTQVGDTYFWRVAKNGSRWNFGYATDTSGGMSTASSYNTGPFAMYYRVSGSEIRYSSFDSYGWVDKGTKLGNSSSAFISNPFEFDYTSGAIDAIPDPDDGLLIRVPSSYTDPDTQVTIYDIHDLINLNPSITQPGGHEINIDPSLNPDADVDVDIGNGIGDIIRTILNLLDLFDDIDFNFAPEPDSPEPGPVDPDPAVPDTPVGEQDGTWLDELLRWIKQAIDTISQSVIDAQDAIVNEIQDLAQQISEIPQQILEDIETGPSKVFRKALDVLKSLFLPLLLPIKSMMGLWHYVVEWLASVNAPFLWIFGVMSGTSSNMVLPIYATLAGSICIAIYKALGR